jgi:hypothetical protein
VGGMTDNKSAPLPVERLITIAFVPALIFWAVSFYVRITTDTDPLWTEFATPLVFALLGAQTIARASSPGSQKGTRAIGILLVACAALILLLTILDI